MALLFIIVQHAIPSALLYVMKFTVLYKFPKMSFHFAKSAFLKKVLIVGRTILCVIYMYVFYTFQVFGSVVSNKYRGPWSKQQNEARGASNKRRKPNFFGSK